MLEVLSLDFHIIGIICLALLPPTMILELIMDIFLYMNNIISRE